MDSLITKVIAYFLTEIAESLQGINRSLGKTDWLSIINIILVPVSIALTAYITNHQNKKMHDLQLQSQLKLEFYPRFKKSLFEAKETFLKNNSDISESLVECQKLVDYNLKHLVPTAKEKPKLHLGEFIDRFRQLIINLENEVLLCLDNTKVLSDTLSDLRSNFSPKHSSALILDDLINQLNLNQKMALIRCNSLYTSINRENTHDEILYKFEQIKDIINPFTDEFQKKWSELSTFTEYKID